MNIPDQVACSLDEADHTLLFVSAAATTSSSDGSSSDGSALEPSEAKECFGLRRETALQCSKLLATIMTSCDPDTASCPETSICLHSVSRPVLLIFQKFLDTIESKREFPLSEVSWTADLFIACIFAADFLDSEPFLSFLAGTATVLCFAQSEESGNVPEFSPGNTLLSSVPLGPDEGFAPTKKIFFQDHPYFLGRVLHSGAEGTRFALYPAKNSFLPPITFRVQLVKSSCRASILGVRRKTWDRDPAERKATEMGTVEGYDLVTGSPVTVPQAALNFFELAMREEESKGNTRSWRNLRNQFTVNRIEYTAFQNAEVRRLAASEHGSENSNFQEAEVDRFQIALARTLHRPEVVPSILPSTGILRKFITLVQRRLQAPEGERRHSTHLGYVQRGGDHHFRKPTTLSIEAEGNPNFWFSSRDVLPMEAMVLNNALDRKETRWPSGLFLNAYPSDSSCKDGIEYLRQRHGTFTLFHASCPPQLPGQRTQKKHSTTVRSETDPSRCPFLFPIDAPTSASKKKAEATEEAAGRTCFPSFPSFPILSPLSETETLRGGCRNVCPNCTSVPGYSVLYQLHSSELKAAESYLREKEKRWPEEWIRLRGQCRPEGSETLSRSAVLKGDVNDGRRTFFGLEPEMDCIVNEIQSFPGLEKLPGLVALHLYRLTLHCRPQFLFRIRMKPQLPHLHFPLPSSVSPLPGPRSSTFLRTYRNCTSLGPEAKEKLLSRGSGFFLWTQLLLSEAERTLEPQSIGYNGEKQGKECLLQSWTTAGHVVPNSSVSSGSSGGSVVDIRVQEWTRLLLPQRAPLSINGGERVKRETCCQENYFSLHQFATDRVTRNLTQRKKKEMKMRTAVDGDNDEGAHVAHRVLLYLFHYLRHFVLTRLYHAVKCGRPFQINVWRSKVSSLKKDEALGNDGAAVSPTVAFIGEVIRSAVSRRDALRSTSCPFPFDLPGLQGELLNFLPGLVPFVDTLLCPNGPMPARNVRITSLFKDRWKADTSYRLGISCCASSSPTAEDAPLVNDCPHDGKSDPGSSGDGAALRKGTKRKFQCNGSLQESSAAGGGGEQESSRTKKKSKTEHGMDTSLIRGVSNRERKSKKLLTKTKVLHLHVSHEELWRGLESDVHSVYTREMTTDDSGYCAE